MKSLFADIERIKPLRDNITYFQFGLQRKCIWMCIGWLVHGIEEFIDRFSLFDLRDERGDAEA